ncbi:MAG TPA: type II toxin-antitoxin system prevent-host-death family antitoxin [Chloroflexota bacterium]|nr:type II toxin-antitoxin system prevent-host-death family antitoxin [Chloroflexota bacterium]
MNRRVSVEEFQGSLEETLERVYDQGDEVVIERNGKPMAAVVPIRRYEALRRSKDQLWELIQKNREANRGADPVEVEAAVEQAIREVREERRRGPAGDAAPR